MSYLLVTAIGLLAPIAPAQAPQRIDPREIFSKQELEKIIPRQPDRAAPAATHTPLPASQPVAAGTPAPQTEAVEPQAETPDAVSTSTATVPATAAAIKPRTVTIESAAAAAAASIAEAARLPPLLLFTPPNTSLMLLINRFDRFRAEYEQRVIAKLREEPALREWPRFGLITALALAYEWIPIHWLGCYQHLQDDLLIGLAERDGERLAFALLENSSRSEAYAQQVRFNLFDGPQIGNLPGSMPSVSTLGFLAGSHDDRLRGSLQTLIEFPLTWPPRQWDAEPFRSADAPENIYFLHYDASTTPASGFISRVTGGARWTSLGVHHEFVIEDAGGSGLAALLGEERPFRSFPYVPRQALFTLAAQFRDPDALYQALTQPDHPLASLLAPARRWIGQLGRPNGQSLLETIFSKLGPEWNFSVVPVVENEVSLLLLAELGNERAAQFGLDRFFGPAAAVNRGTYRNVSYFRVQLAGGGNWTIGIGNGFLLLTDRLETLKAAVEVHESGGAFEDSAQQRAAQQRLAAGGIIYGYYHIAGCLARMARELERMPLDKPGLFGVALPPMPFDVPAVENPPTLNAILDNPNVIGCVRLSAAESAFRVEVHSATGNGPYELLLAALIERHLYGRLREQVGQTRQKLNLLNQKIAEFAASNQHPPRFRINTEKQPHVHEMYPYDQLQLPPQLDLRDPFSGSGQSLVYLAVNSGWILVSRGPDRDLDLTLPEQFKADQEHPFEDFRQNLYDPANGLVSNGDLVVYRRR